MKPEDFYQKVAARRRQAMIFLTIAAGSFFLSLALAFFIDDFEVRGSVCTPLFLAAFPLAYIATKWLTSCRWMRCPACGSRLKRVVYDHYIHFECRTCDFCHNTDIYTARGFGARGYKR